MAGVTVDSVIVALEARVQKYQTDLAAATKQTQDAFKKMRDAAKQPITPKIGATQNEAVAVEKSEARKQRARKKTAETEEQAQSRIAAVVARAEERDNARTASSERNSRRRVAAINKELQAAQTRLMSSTSLGSGTQPVTNRGLTYADVRNDALQSRARLLAGSASGDRASVQALRDQAAYLKLINEYKRRGLSASDAQVRAERAITEAVKRRTAQEQAAARANALRSAQSGSGAGLATRALLPAVGVGTAVAAAKQFLEIADASKNLDAQLRLATEGFGSFAQAQVDVRRISNETRSDIETTAKLYSNFTRNARELGITQAEAARATETVAKAFIVSGASTVEATQATRQLIQGLQSGTLRGDELNSVLEAAPRLSRLVASSLGVTVGQLRSLAEEGKLTSKALTDAFTNTKFTAELDREFNQLPVTFAQSMNLVYNAAIETFGAFDRGGEFSETIANFVRDGANGFASMADAAERLGATIRSEFSGIAAVAGTIAGAFESVVKFLGDAGLRVEDINKQFYQSLRQLIPIVDLIERIRGSDTYQNARNSTQRRLDGQIQQRRFDRLNSGRDALGNPIVGTPGGGRTTPTAIPESASAKRQREAAARRAENEARRARRQQAQDEAQDRQAQLDIIRAKQQLTDNVEERASYEIDAALLEREQQIANVKNDETLNEAERKARLKYIETLYGKEGQDVSTLGQLGLRGEQLNKDKIDRERDRERDILSRVNDAENDRLNDELTLAETRAERSRIQNQILDLEIKQRERLLKQEREDALRAGNSRLVTQIDNEIAALPAARASGQAQIDQQNEGPIAQRLRQIRNTEDVVENTVLSQLQSVEDGITNAVQGVIRTKNPILDALIRGFIQQQLIAPILQAFQSSQGGGGLFGFGSIISSVFGTNVLSGRASGGNVVAGQMYRINEGGGVEGFRPAQSGTIIPLGRMNKAVGGGSTVIQQTVKVDARNSVNPDGFARQILAISGQQAQKAATQAARATYQAVPQRINEFNKDGI